MTLIGRSSTGPTTRRTKAGDLLENHQMDNLLEDQQRGTFWKIINLTIYSNCKFDDLRNHQNLQENQLQDTYWKDHILEDQQQEIN